MYIHLGGDVLINKDKIVAIIDLETEIENQNNDKFIKRLELNNKMKNISEHGKRKTLVITTNEAYLSPISSMTLYKRSFSNLEGLV